MVKAIVATTGGSKKRHCKGILWLTRGIAADSGFRSTKMTTITRIGPTTVIIPTLIEQRYMPRVPGTSFVHVPVGRTSLTNCAGRPNNRPKIREKSAQTARTATS
jgi:hypothetical protein